MNNRRRQRIKATMRTQKGVIRSVINRISAMVSKNRYNWTQDMTKCSEILREGLRKLFGNKFNDTMIEVNADATNSNLIHANIKTSDPKLIKLLQEVESED